MNDVQNLIQDIDEHVQRGWKICLNFGFGTKPISGFFNIDRPREHMWGGYFFDWLKAPLPIDDERVDFAFSEDMIEHLTQQEQILYLAEVLRVLKPGGVHRINTPDLLWSMSRSDFRKGWVGVYDEWSIYGHQCVLTFTSLYEIALMVGYKSIRKCQKETWEHRPGPDRDSQHGNIIVELMKEAVDSPKTP